MLTKFLVLELFTPPFLRSCILCGEIGFGSSIIGVETITVHLLFGQRAFQSSADLELKPYFTLSRLIMEDHRIGDAEKMTRVRRDSEPG